MKLSPNSCLRSSQKHQEPLPLFFTLATAFILLKNLKNHYICSSPQPLPSFFSKTPRTTAFDLLKNPRLRSSKRGCWWLLKKNKAVGGAWVLMVAWEERSKRMTTPLQNSLRLEFYMDYNSTFVLPAHKTWVSKTQILHGIRASKVQDVNFVNSLKNVLTNKIISKIMLINKLPPYFPIKFYK